MIFCQDIIVEVPDSTFQPAMELVPTPPTIDISAIFNNIVQEAITLGEETEFLEHILLWDKVLINRLFNIMRVLLDIFLQVDMSSLVHL